MVGSTGNFASISEENWKTQHSIMIQRNLKEIEALQIRTGRPSATFGTEIICITSTHHQNIAIG